MRCQIRCYCRPRFCDALQDAAEHEKIGRVDISGKTRRISLQEFARGSGRNFNDTEGMAQKELLLSLCQRLCSHGNVNSLISIQSHDELTAQFCAIEIDDGDRDVPQRLAEIGLRIEDAIQQGPHHHQPLDAAIPENAPDLTNDNAAESRDMTAGEYDDLDRLALCGRLPRARQRPQSQPAKAEICQSEER